MSTKITVKHHGAGNHALKMMARSHTLKMIVNNHGAGNHTLKMMARAQYYEGDVSKKNIKKLSS